MTLSSIESRIQDTIGPRHETPGVFLQYQTNKQTKIQNTTPQISPNVPKPTVTKAIKPPSYQTFFPTFLQPFHLFSGFPGGSVGFPKGFWGFPGVSSLYILSFHTSPALVFSSVLDFIAVCDSIKSGSILFTWRVMDCVFIFFKCFLCFF